MRSSHVIAEAGDGRAVATPIEFSPASRSAGPSSCWGLGGCTAREPRGRSLMAVDQWGQPVDHTSDRDTSQGLITPDWVTWTRACDAESPKTPDDPGL